MVASTHCCCCTMLILYRDQEMRFTVHDSPDYYQLKVSVFNDDRKTEIIGETWVSLDKIIVLGGGQNDLWHQLNCKGRYAGEIRIELTYYDTRPKETKTEDRRQSSTVNEMQDPQREGSIGLSGPRQPKQVKRRPLPADPTMPDSSRSPTQPYTPPPSHQYLPDSQQQSPSHVQSVVRESPKPVDSQYTRMDPRGAQPDLYRHGQAPSADGIVASHSPEHQHPEYGKRTDKAGDGYVNMNGHIPENNNYANQSTPLPAHYSNEQSYRDGNGPDVSNPSGWSPEHGYSRPIDHDGSDAYTTHAKPGTYEISPSKIPSLPQHLSMPNVRLPHSSPISEQSRSRSSLPAIDSYEQQSPRHYSPVERPGAPIGPPEGIEDDGPPPPPAHRSSPLQSPPNSQGQVHAESYSPLAGPPPLNIRNPRNSISASPLSQVQTNTHHTDFQPFSSPSPVRSFPQSAPLRSSFNSYGQPHQRRSPEHISVSPRRDYGHMTPPSLVPGYNSRIAGEESERSMHENQSNFRQNSEPIPQYLAFATHNTLNRAHPTPRHDVSAQPRLVDNSQDRRPHRASAPAIPQREVSPDPRMPVRKSVSPQPEQASSERRSSAVPFGPDSYDAFNPSLSDVASINSVGPKYNTPEQSREAHYEREREAKLGEGPIIGSDGRVIDPSDHLPTETWAPEPEAKAPKKKPEFTVRFRRSPAGAQPMPPSATRRTPTDMPARPNPMITPAYARSSDPTISPTAGARARLQKGSRVAVAQPVSSPAVPTLNTSIQTPASRPNHSDYPFQGHGNYVYGNSPTYARGSPGGAPPPVPGKVPLSAGVGQEGWNVNALSEEMRRIDIGVGGGQGRVRRTRYGA